MKSINTLFTNKLLLALLLLGWAAIATITTSGCGFKLKSFEKASFSSIVLKTPGNSPLAPLLREALAEAQIAVLDTPPPEDLSFIILEIPKEETSKSIVNTSTAGQVQELELHLAVDFSVREQSGKERIPLSHLRQQRSLSFNETAALSKAEEETKLYQSMRNDIVQQIMRRLTVLKPSISGKNTTLKPQTNITSAPHAAEF